MNIVLTLDYEVFFGRGGGDARRCLVEPTEALLATVRPYGVPLVFFVDVLWLQKLREAAYRHAGARADFEATMRQLDGLARNGHELQLHLHPHWLDARFDGQHWSADFRRYRLHDLDDADIRRVAAEGAASLRNFAPRCPVNTFRAGGWCLQPFDRLREPLLNAGIRVDSTVFAGGIARSLDRGYDFRGAPEASRWRFDADPLQAVAGGAFVEVPIASHRVWPSFYWQLAWARKFGGPEHRALGDGQALAPSRADLAARLLAPSHSVVSIDGMKADFLEAAWSSHWQRGREDFVVLGHPKATTRHSLRRLDEFLGRHRGQRFCGLAHHGTALEDASPVATRPNGAAPRTPSALTADVA
jgi:hypothetical protein